jgi:hypothetical protein
VSYRDDLDAAVTRADAVDRENRHLTDENRRLTAELAEARDMIGKGAVWLGGGRLKLLLGISAIVCIGVGAGALLVGRMTAECPECRIPPPARLPVTIGTMVADGPKFGHWTLNATRCVRRSDGIELTASGEEKHVIWLTNNVIELEVPNNDFLLEEKHCFRRGLLVETNEKQDPVTYSGHVELDCRLDGGGWIQGRIEFQNCR